MLSLKMDRGETRHVRLRIHNIKDEAFTIMRASYDLTFQYEKEPEAEGNIDVSIDTEHILDVVITPEKYGQYILTYTYQIADETLMDRVEVNVV